MFSDRPFIRNTLFAAVTALCSVASPAAYTMDIVRENDQVPAPSAEQRGIWGAIAFSPIHNKYGFFWGADKRKEAEDIAVKLCEDRADSGCYPVVTFRNHRHWTDDDKSGFPYEHCAALSVAEDKDHKVTRWGAASATTHRQAEDAATKNCGDSNKCEIQEWVCT